MYSHSLFFCVVMYYLKFCLSNHSFKGVLSFIQCSWHFLVTAFFHLATEKKNSVASWHLPKKSSFQTLRFKIFLIFRPNISIISWLGLFAVERTAKMCCFMGSYLFHYGEKVITPINTATFLKDMFHWWWHKHAKTLMYLFKLYLFYYYQDLM